MVVVYSRDHKGVGVAHEIKSPKKQPQFMMREYWLGKTKPKQAFRLTCYTAVQIKNCSKSTPAIEVATMKNMYDFYYKGKPSHATTKSTLFAVNKDEWDTKEDTGKSMKNALYILQYAKRHLLG